MALDLKVTNLSALSEAGYEFELKLPDTNLGTGGFITVRGSNSPKVKEHGKKAFSTMQMKETMAKRKGRDLDPMSLDEAEEMAVESALVRIINWRGITEGKDELKFEPDTARRILKEHDWIRSQIIDESDALANFI